MKAKLILIFLFIMLSTGNLFALDRNRKVAPPQDNLHLVLTQSLFNQTHLMDESTKRIIYISYISGFLDAMQMDFVNPETAKRFIDECSGLTLGDLMDMMIKFKEENSQWRDIGPAYTLTIAIPRLRKGLPGFPGDTENKVVK